MRRIQALIRVALLASTLPFVGCSGLFDVDSPGKIADTDLDQSDAVPGIVAGISKNVTDSYDELVTFSALASGELWHGGSYDWAKVPRGIIKPEDVNGTWGQAQQARWVAEQGVERIKGILSADAFASSADVARSYYMAGIANRLLGENACFAVIDGGPQEPNTVYFDRAIEHFSKAIEIGTTAGAQSVVDAAYAGRASVKADKGDWAGAVADAARVPATLMVVAPFQLPDPGNTLAYETHNRYEYTVWNTFMQDHPDDPRAVWEILYRSDGSVSKGANGAALMYQQNKYPDQAADVPEVKGTEMLVLRAEAALRDNDIAGAFDLLNQARAVYGMEPLAVPTDPTEAWATLRYERSATTWLEARHFFDEQRWYKEQGPAHSDFLEGRDKCMPISQDEMNSNPNLKG